MQPTVLLFDIDGTLISSGGAGRRSFEQAVFRVIDRRDVCDFSFAGMTDRAIARTALLNAGHEPSDEVIDRLVSTYITLLAEELPYSDCRVHPGIAEALEATANRPGVAIGLGTGNVLPGARLKLGRVGLFHRFSFGGYGCDHEVRHELLRIGASRGAAALGAPVDACRVVVIGDTPKDVAAAQAIGADCIAVATGQYGLDALVACNPTQAFQDLTADKALGALLG
ncbi:HAD family hydrolase [Chondromyces crocatus]|uniref:phosphoglycolate phosphatase n=1 Tax=Chondromyces crocatus TaxID=52 RepID=A0A0K1EEE7_CHOCO|nr:HAD family hydrolase [Chondromyces crocatus]AKT39241.1 haloacid dehalogenase [Chondromyces crocatus]